MIPKFKEFLSFQGSIYNAAVKRAEELFGRDLSAKELLVKVNQIINGLTSLNYNFSYNLLPTNSAATRLWHQDFKYFSALSLGQLNTISEAVSLDTAETLANISALQQEVRTLNTEVREKELELLGNHSKVHLNNFTRSIDSALQYRDKSWLEDFKTGFSYSEKYLMEPKSGVGLTLPVRAYEKNVIVDAILLKERTSVGDTISALQASDVRNLFLKDKVFKYVLLKKEFDGTSRKRKIKTSFDTYPYNCTATLTVQLELANVMYTNTLKVVPVSDSGIFIKKISYINESGEEVVLNSVTFSCEDQKVLLFEPVFTKYFIIEFEQYSHLSRTTVETGDKRVAAINKILTANGFVNKLPHISSLIEGRVYDFSLKDIELGVSLYENKGIFRSLPIEVSGPLGLEVSKSNEAIIPTLSLETTTDMVVMPAGNVLQEAYIGARLFDKNGNKRVDSLFPVLDSGLVQLELLSPIGSKCRYKLFPDLDWSAEEICISDLTLSEVCEETLEADTFPGYGATEEEEEEDTFTEVFPGIEPAGFAELPDELHYEKEVMTDYFIQKWLDFYYNNESPTITNGFRFTINPEDPLIHLKTLQGKVASMLAKSGYYQNNNQTINYSYSIPDETFEKFYGNLWTALTESERETISENPFLYFMIGGEIYPSRNGDIVYICGRRIFADSRYDRNSQKLFFEIKLLTKQKNFEGELDLHFSLKLIPNPVLSKFNRIISDKIRLNLSSSSGPTIEEAPNLREFRMNTLYQKLGYVVDPVTNVIRIATAPVNFPIYRTPLTARDSNESGLLGFTPSRYPRLPERDEECTPSLYLMVTTMKKHGLSPGDIVVVSSSRDPSADGIVIKVIHVIDDYRFYIAPNPELVTAFENRESNNICFYVSTMDDLVEVFENGRLLTIGDHYSISMDDGSIWYDSWPTIFALYSDAYRRAAAGRFIIRLKNADPTKFYWTRYLVKRNQSLSSCGKVFLKNGRVTFDKSLGDTYGTLQTVIISRAMMLHPYLTSILREYSLAIQTRGILNNKTGFTFNTPIVQKALKGTINVS